MSDSPPGTIRKQPKTNVLPNNDEAMVQPAAQPLNQPVQPPNPNATPAPDATPAPPAAVSPAAAPPAAAPPIQPSPAPPATTTTPAAIPVAVLPTPQGATKEDITLPEEKKEEENEKSPKGRYVRYEEIGRGSFKVVYKAFDSESGKTVAWNEVNIMSLPPTEKKRVISEVKILERVAHERIISFYGSWYDAKNHKVVFMTEIVTEGTLRGFCDKVSGLRLMIVRKWATQILDGLIYLHTQSPPIIHRDLKCENVFVKGEDGSIKIGDLGLSTQVTKNEWMCARSRRCTVPLLRDIECWH